MTKQELKKKTEVVSNKTPGLEQTFLSSTGEFVLLADVLNESDWWESKSGKKISVILTHSAVEKIAELAGLKVIDYIVKTQPDCYNNYQYTVQANIVRKDGSMLNPEWGEANRNNLGNKGRNNPANMAQKRAFDRTVLKGLNLLGLLSEEEIADENDDNKMNNLNPDEAKAIAIVLNRVLTIKTKPQLTEFNQWMSKEAKKYTKEQNDAIRKTFNAKIIELNKTKF